MLYEKGQEYLSNSRDERFMVTSFTVKENKRDKVEAAKWEKPKFQASLDSYPYGVLGNWCLPLRFSHPVCPIAARWGK